MKITCDVVKDLLPLYQENMLSDDSRALVNEHIADCDACKKVLDYMKTETVLMDTNVTPLLKIKTKLRRKKVITVLFSVMLSLAVAVLFVAYLTAPEYTSYRDANISITEMNNGMVVAVFSDQVSGYDISKYQSDEYDGYVVHMTTWDSVWNRIFGRSRVNSVVLNPDGEAVTAVYYYQTDGVSDRLIYGLDTNPGGGIITLPRLVLSYYFLLALGFTGFCALLIFLFRKNEKARELLTKVLFVPISYLLAHLLIKGFHSSSYLALRDFLAILLLTVPLYLAFLAAITYIKNDKKKKADIF